MEYEIPNNAELFADSNRGVYIPQHFAESVMRECVQGVSNEQWTILESGPDHEWYWNEWDMVLNNARMTDRNGRKWFLYQDGDLWLIPEE